MAEDMRAELAETALRAIRESHDVEVVSIGTGCFVVIRKGFDETVDLYRVDVRMAHVEVFS